MATMSFFLLLGMLAEAILVHGQTGFMSIDCGLTANTSYISNRTGTLYISDSQFIDTGEIFNISTKFIPDSLSVQNINLRSFPSGVRNCYTLRPVQRGTKYLIRAGFMYGNYDSQDRTPRFDIHLGVNYWATIIISNSSGIYGSEIMAIALADYVSVCLVNTGYGPPFISTLELRPLDSAMYVALNESNALLVLKRQDIGSSSQISIRYPGDAYDRLWFPLNSPSWTPVATSSGIRSVQNDGFNVPSMVMATAAAPSDGSIMQFSWYPEDRNFSAGCHIFLHFAELLSLTSNDSRSIDVYLNGELWVGAFTPRYLEVSHIVTTQPLINDHYNLSISKAANSTLSPILNALEILSYRPLTALATNSTDVDAIMDIKALYQVKRSWTGDPCAPKDFTWVWLNCSYDSSEQPRIISLNLSYSGLNGEISTSFAKLEALKYLDLSSNNLTGSIPDFLAELPFLQFLNLSNNHLTGSVPRSLQEKSAAKSLILSISDNPGLFYTSNSNKNQKSKVSIIIVVSVIGAMVLLVVMVFVWRARRRKIASSLRNQKEDYSTGVKHNRLPFQSESQQYSYKELVKITKDFERVIGKGGFGTVYYGELEDGTPVAVKMRSQSSLQGTREFETEAQLLTRVHHRNLVSLVGYCQDENYLALIYEYMSQGSLQDHLTGKSSNTSPLYWSERLRIALEAAQGLEYLHKGCKPPIIHRDVKTTNILLSQKLEAKIADFGLSRSFQNDSFSHISTAVVGTMGYVDPEYYFNYQLNEKSDVYSFGVVLLELITGHSAILNNEEKGHIVQWVRLRLAKGDIDNVVDGRLREDYDINSVWKAAEIAIKCTLPTSIPRPIMSDVVIQLKECLALEVARKRAERFYTEAFGTSPSDTIQLVHMEADLIPGPSVR